MFVFHTPALQNCISYIYRPEVHHKLFLTVKCASNHGAEMSFTTERMKTHLTTTNYIEDCKCFVLNLTQGLMFL